MLLHYFSKKENDHKKIANSIYKCIILYVGDIINKKDFWDLEFDDFKLINYKHHPVIKFPVAV